MTYTYTPSIPLSNDIPSVSQGQLQQNFQAIGAYFANNHYALNDASVALRGMHKFVTLEQQSAAPATTSTQAALYTKTAGSATNLFYRRASSGTEIQMTTNADPVVGTSGQTFLPGGLILKWGQGAFGGATTTATFPGGAFPTACVLVVVGPFNAVGAQSGLYVSTWTAATATIGRATSLSSTYNYTYIAIGY